MWANGGPVPGRRQAAVGVLGGGGALLVFQEGGHALVEGLVGSTSRRLQIRWDRGSERWVAFVLLACALTCFDRL
jgi:hypothetical protein